MQKRDRARWIDYGAAVLAPVATMLMLWPLGVMVGDRVMYIAFIPAILLAAYRGGLGPGFAATALGAVLATYFLIEPRFSLRVESARDVAALILFVLVGTISSGLGESLHRKRRRIAAHEGRRVDEALRESDRRWRSLTEALPQLVWSATPDGACDYFSTQWTQHTGIPENELLGWRWLEALHPDDREPTRQFWMASVAGRGPYDVEYRVRARDGSYRWFKTRGVPIRDSAGEIVKWFGTCTDFTDLKRAEEALRESEQRFRQLAENVRGVFWLQEGAWERLLYISPLYEEFFGRTCQSLYEQPRSWIESVHPEDRDLVFNHLEQQNRGISTETNFRITRPDGSTRWMCCHAFPLKNQAGEFYRVGGLVEDISERRQFEEELRRAKEAAEAANRGKDEFLANVSHEIRTPMNAIMGMTELALDAPRAEDQRQHLKTVKSAADNLLGILNDLLDFSKIEAGKLELDPADFGLRAILGDTLRTLAIRAHKNGLELASHVQPDVPDALIGDASRLRQVLLNLVGNAIKFTTEGEVVLRVELAGETASDDDLALIRFAVTDTGVGIPREKQETIFRAFEQEDSSTTRRFGGTGLGLTIAARLVNLMGGNITVDSEPGRGSTFAFTAQFGRQPHPPGPVAHRPPVVLSNLPVLVVDDNATNRQILEEWLRGWQMQPVARGDGFSALDAIWHSAASGRPFPLVLLDARMPDTDGLTLATTIRERVELAATRIILLSSGDTSADQARFRELRIDARLLKPVQQDELLETIYRVMSRAHDDANGATRPASAEPSTSVEVATADALHILVAEDNEFNAQLVEELLVRRGHRVKVANNGRAALALAEGGGFDLLLLDIHMPELDGLQVIQAIRARERISGGHLPVIALTASSRKEERERCVAAGMDDFLSKPIRAADLWAAIGRVVVPCAPAARESSELLDPVVLWNVCGGDTAILEKLRQTFMNRLPDHMAAVQEALRDRDSVRLRESAHKLSGMVAAFSSVAGGVASALEEHAARDELEEARPLVAQLGSMVEELLRQTNGLSLETLRYQAEAADQADRVGDF
jgi:two-component system, sensor histidine kinase and response regulator